MREVCEVATRPPKGRVSRSVSNAWITRATAFFLSADCVPPITIFYPSTRFFHRTYDCTASQS